MKRGKQCCAAFLIGRAETTAGFAEIGITPDADPIQSLWYVSPELNAPRALDQMESAATACPEILLGYDESYLFFSDLAAGLCRLLGERPPYWLRFARRSD